jgi:hypothetical protein
LYHAAHPRRSASQGPTANLRPSRPAASTVGAVQYGVQLGSTKYCTKYLCTVRGNRRLGWAIRSKSQGVERSCIIRPCLLSGLSCIPLASAFSRSTPGIRIQGRSCVSYSYGTSIFGFGTGDRHRQHRIDSPNIRSTSVANCPSNLSLICSPTVVSSSQNKQESSHVLRGYSERACRPETKEPLLRPRQRRHGNSSAAQQMYHGKL